MRYFSSGAAAASLPWRRATSSLLALCVGVQLAACSGSGAGTPSIPRSDILGGVPSANGAANVQYEFIDLGTLGGPTSYGSINGFGTRILNDAGIVASRADTTQSDPYAPACFNQDCFVSHASRWKNGAIADLGVLPAGGSSAAGGINNQGWAIGQAQTGQPDPFLGGIATHAVFWGTGPIVDIGTLGGSTSAGTDLNDSGTAVGFSETGTSDPFIGAQIHSFIWKGSVQDIGTLGGPDAFNLEPEGCGTCINDSGQIAGASFTNSVPNASTGLPTMDPFLWQNGRMTDLGSLGGTFGGPTFLSDAGAVVGASNLAGDTATHPFLWKNGVMKDLGTLGGDIGFPFWINEEDDVVGVASLAGDAAAHAFFWRSGVMTDLGTLGNDSIALSVNGSDEVVGTSFVSGTAPTGRAFVWRPGTSMVDLNALIPSDADLILVAALDVNDSGEIAGVGFPRGAPPNNVEHTGHAFLLVPCVQQNHPCTARNSSGSATGMSLQTLRQAADSGPAAAVRSLRKKIARRLHISLFDKLNWPL